MQAGTVFDVHDLIGHPGEERSAEAEVVAGDDLGAGMAKATQGSLLDVRVQLESVHEGIFVHGTVGFQISAECSRCLKPFSWHDEVAFGELFAYRSGDLSDHVSEDESESEVVDSRIDLEQVLRDAIVLDLPFQPVCDQYDAGPCEADGFREAAESEVQTDPRWGPLAGLLDAQRTEDSNQK